MIASPWPVLRAEWLKQRRSLAGWLILAGGLFTPLIIFAVRLRQNRGLPTLYASSGFWEKHWTQSWESITIMILPMMGILITALVAQIEFRNNTWKQVHASPLRPAAVFFAKLAVILAMLLQLFVVLNAGVYLSAVLPALLLGHAQPADPVPAGLFLARNLRFFVDCLPVVALQYALALHFRNFMVPVGAGIGVWILTIGMFNTRVEPPSPLFLSRAGLHDGFGIPDGGRAPRGDPGHGAGHLRPLYPGGIRRVRGKERPGIVKRGVVALLHAGYWAAYLLLLALLLAVLRLQLADARPFLTPRLAARLAGVAVAPNAAAFYLSYLVLFPRLLARRRVAALLAAGAAVSAGCAALALAGTCLGPGQAGPVCASPAEAAALMAWLVPVAGLHAAAALVMRGFVGWYGDLRVKEELARKTHEVETALVRSKLDPHFLFNTLNNIDVLIARDAAAASAYLNKLCELMRFVLYEARAETIPLASELAYIETYLDLERIRSANPRHVVYEVTGDPGGLSIAPMVFIPFLENAFKHAASTRAEDDVTVAVHVRGRRVDFLCSNRHRGGGGPAPVPGGLGNPLMARRLELLYPGRHALDVADRDGRYTVRLTVDLHDPLHHR